MQQKVSCTPETVSTIIAEKVAAGWQMLEYINAKPGENEVCTEHTLLFEDSPTVVPQTDAVRIAELEAQVAEQAAALAILGVTP